MLESDNQAFDTGWSDFIRAARRVIGEEGVRAAFPLFTRSGFYSGSWLGDLGAAAAPASNTAEAALTLSAPQARRGPRPGAPARR